MELIIGAILIGLIPAFIAQRKGERFLPWWVFGAALFIVALPISLIMKPNAKALEQRQLAAGMKKCPHCAELVKADAVVCRYCGRDVQQAAAPVATATAAVAAAIRQPTKAPPSRAGKIALGVVLVFGVLFVLMIVIGLLTSPGARETTSPAAARESPVEPAMLVREAEPEKVQASALVAAYERNEIAAGRAFKGKTLEIEGVVETIAKDILGATYVTLDRDGVRSVQAMFPRRSANALTGLRPGQRIVVRCKVDSLMMNVLASDCVLR
jgi:hypothetical protein